MSLFIARIRIAMPNQASPATRNESSRMACGGNPVVSSGRHCRSALTILRLRVIALAIAICLARGASAEPSDEVLITTSLGNIVAVVDSIHAPKTAANFLTYVDQHLYDGGAFHRTVTKLNQPGVAVKIAIIQARGAPAIQGDAFPAIELERTSTTGLTHLAGTLSMARSTPDSATDQFFICLSDQHELDYGGSRNPDGQGFAAFGHVVSGMEVVRRIHRAQAEGQRLTPAIQIISVRRVDPQQTPRQ